MARQPEKGYLICALKAWVWRRNAMKMVEQHEAVLASQKLVNSLSGCLRLMMQPESGETRNGFRFAAAVNSF